MNFIREYKEQAGDNVVIDVCVVCNEKKIGPGRVIQLELIDPLLHQLKLTPQEIATYNALPQEYKLLHHVKVVNTCKDLPPKRDESLCLICDKTCSLICGKCKNANYCSNKCQKISWNSGHKHYCSKSYKDEDLKCYVCRKDTIGNHCGTCLKVRYCSTKCQSIHWKGGHKLECQKTLEFLHYNTVDYDEGFNKMNLSVGDEVYYNKKRSRIVDIKAGSMEFFIEVIGEKILIEGIQCDRVIGVEQHQLSFIKDGIQNDYYHLNYKYIKEDNTLSCCVDCHDCLKQLSTQIKYIHISIVNKSNQTPLGCLHHSHARMRSGVR